MIKRSQQFCEIPCQIKTASIAITIPASVGLEALAGERWYAVSVGGGWVGNDNTVAHPAWLNTYLWHTHCLWHCQPFDIIVRNGNILADYHLTRIDINSVEFQSLILVHSQHQEIIW